MNLETSCVGVMSLHFGTSNGNGKRFSIDDAFEEETDEAIRVYGSTGACSPVKSSRASTESSYTNPDKADHDSRYIPQHTIHSE